MEARAGTDVCGGRGVVVVGGGKRRQAAAVQRRGSDQFDDFGGAALGVAAALIFVEDFFAEAQVLGGGFDVFVGADVFQGAFEGEFERRGELDALAIAGGAHVGEALGFAGVDGDVVFAGVFADDHAFVNFVAWLDHEAAAFLNHVEGRRPWLRRLPC